ncbi:hypothetical protein [Streptomyces sp. NPDC056361]|uniref:hypothetical protein n=1 Tax=Streptomyces sp. NPDC056361 TaxID=3345795 RepID=UPI0035DB4619
MNQEQKNGTSKAMELLKAIVSGDAEMEDGLAELRSDGIVSLEDALTVLKQEVKVDQLVDGPRPDFQALRRSPSEREVSSIEHVVPEVPFLLGGTLYEPQDITRFNGQELHFFTSPNADRMLAVDDRDTMADWLQYEYFDRYRDISKAAEFRVVPGATWFEHDYLQGAALFSHKDRGYQRLSQISMGLFAGDWNDKISSFSMRAIGVVQLSDAYYYYGPFWYYVVPAGTPYAEVLSLTPYGWNDRASSVGCW